VACSSGVLQVKLGASEGATDTFPAFGKSTERRLFLRMKSLAN
jgi:hypothetical protein